MRRPKVILPTIDANGTGKEKLLDLRTDVEMTLDAAHEALCRMAPDAKDYGSDPERMEQAAIQHRRRLDTLKGLIDEIRAEIGTIEEL